MKSLIIYNLQFNFYFLLASHFNFQNVNYSLLNPNYSSNDYKFNLQAQDNEELTLIKTTKYIKSRKRKRFNYNEKIVISDSDSEENIKKTVFSNEGEFINETQFTFQSDKNNNLSPKEQSYNTTDFSFNFQSVPINELNQQEQSYFKTETNLKELQFNFKTMKSIELNFKEQLKNENNFNLQPVKSNENNQQEQNIKTNFNSLKNNLLILLNEKEGNSIKNLKMDTIEVKKPVLKINALLDFGIAIIPHNNPTKYFYITIENFGDNIYDFGDYNPQIKNYILVPFDYNQKGKKFKCLRENDFITQIYGNT